MEPEPHAVYVRVYPSQYDREAMAWVAAGPYLSLTARTPEEAEAKYLADPGVVARMEQPMFYRGEKRPVWVPDGARVVVLNAEDLARWERVSAYVLDGTPLPEDARRKAAGDVVAATAAAMRGGVPEHLLRRYRERQAEQSEADQRRWERTERGEQ